MYGIYHASPQTLSLGEWLGEQAMGIAAVGIAAVERFWGRLKAEDVYRRAFGSRAEARRLIFLGIEGGAHRRRRHAALGDKMPEPFEAGLN